MATTLTEKIHLNQGVRLIQDLTSKRRRYSTCLFHLSRREQNYACRYFDNLREAVTDYVERTKDLQFGFEI